MIFDSLTRFREKLNGNHRGCQIGNEGDSANRQVELYRQILDLQAEIMNGVEENRNLTTEILSLKEMLKTKESLKFQHNAYWKKNPDGTPTEGPFCSRCWDKENQTVRMLVIDSQWHECPSCKEPVNTSGRGDATVTVVTNIDPSR